MKKEDLIKLGLDEATAAKVAEASAEELKGFIPKSRFDEVNNAKNQLDKDIAARDKQLDDLKKVDAAGLQAEIEKLQGQNKADKEAFEKQVKQIQLDTAVEKELSASNAKNTIALKALLKLDGAELDADGKVKGLAEQVKVLKDAEDTKFMFNDDKPAFKGMKPGETKDTLPGAVIPTNSLEAAVKAHLEAN